MSCESAPTAFFDKTYDEALALLIEARNYVASGEADDRARMLPLDRLQLSRETLRVTARLTHIMAWLLFQKAVFAGEIPREEAADRPYRLEGHAVCSREKAIVSGSFPPRLADLLDRSQRLYNRVARLDALVAKT